ncbi:MAG: hypothetical protein V1775_18985 [Bacteroidota bacterium]
MLELVLDKAFVDTFHLAYKDNEEYADDFTRYFLKHLHLCKLVTNYRDMDELMKAARRNPLLEMIVERIPKVEFKPDFNNEIDSPGFPIIGSPMKLILSGQENEICDHRRKRFGLEYINPENLKDRWPLYYSRRTDINKKTTTDSELPAEVRFDSWERFKPFIHPLNAVIIIDFYLLNWEREDEFNNNLNNNIIPLLENLLAEASTEVPVNISFISEFKDRPPKRQAERVNKSKHLLESAIKKITTKPFKLNLIVHNKQNYPRDYQEFHDRIIITNYFYINCGAGFNISSKQPGIGIFNSTGKIGKIRHNSEIQFRSILNIQNYWTAFKDLKQLDIYCEKLENYPNLPDYLNFLPEKENRLMEIEHGE